MLRFFHKIFCFKCYFAADVESFSIGTSVWFDAFAVVDTWLVLFALTFFRLVMNFMIK